MVIPARDPGRARFSESDVPHPRSMLCQMGLRGRERGLEVEVATKLDCLSGWVGSGVWM